MRRKGEPGFSEYCTWQGMHRRCTNSDDLAYKYYGGRGITVCKEWKDFEVFLKDMGFRPQGLSLDRINNDRGYNKENCRWATSSQQTQNSRTTRNIMIKGTIKPISHWLRECSESAIRSRSIYEFKVPLHEVFEVSKEELVELSNYEVILWTEERLEECCQSFKERTGTELSLLKHFPSTPLKILLEYGYA